MYRVKSAENIRKEIHDVTHAASMVIPDLLRIIRDSELGLSPEDQEILLEAVKVAADASAIAAVTREVGSD